MIMPMSVKRITRDQAEQMLQEKFEDNWRFVVALGLTSDKGITKPKVSVYEKRNFDTIQTLFLDTNAVVEYTGPEIPF